MRISHPGEGEAGENNGPPGDLYVVISVKEHELFSRQDSEVICEIPISFTQAALGAKIWVPTLDGKVELSIPPGTQSGKVFRLRGRGIPHLGSSGRGDQHVNVTVEVPRALTKKQRELLEQFADTMGEAQSPRTRSFLEKVKGMFGGDPPAEQAGDETGS
jgi:molecular chaperone DnaJ